MANKKSTKPTKSKAGAKLSVSKPKFAKLSIPANVSKAKPKIKAKPIQKSKPETESKKEVQKRKIVLQTINAGNKFNSKIDSKLDKLAKFQVREQKEIRHVEGTQARIERDLASIEKFESRENQALKEIEQREKKIEAEEARIEELLAREDKVLSQIEQKESEIEESVMKVGTLVVSRSQFIDITRAAAGAFLACGLTIRFFDVYAIKTMPIQFIGILPLVIIFSAILIYFREKENVKRLGKMYLLGRVAMIYLVCLVVELISFALFGLLPTDNLPQLAETVIIGSYITIAGALAFSLI